jgi:hypothetical protein
MPKAADWTNFVYINLAFIAQIVAIYYFTAISDLKKNWAKYRCNPMYMPFSDNIQQDFVYCVQNVQTDYMGYLLQPINYLTSNLTSLGGEFTQSMNGVRSMISNIRSFSSNIVQSIFGVFLNLIIEFQKIIIGIKDVIGKVIGIMVTLMYVLDGSIKTMKSSWNGPPGQMVRSLGNCFHPATQVSLKNGAIKKMENLSLGDVLKDGSRVLVTMKIENTGIKEYYYKFENAGENGETIYVTGSHYVLLDNESKKYIQVKDHPTAIAEKGRTSEWFSCLITDSHRIPIGDLVFWDWEDDNL